MESSDQSNNSTPAAEDTKVTMVKSDIESKIRKLEEDARKYIARQSKAVILPSYGKWFDIDKIHEIEKRSLPEFFAGESRFKTAKVYQEMRDFMVHTYRLNPLEYLTVTSVRRNLAGDVASIMRIHSFLSRWGIINYQIDPKTRPFVLGPQYTGHFQVVLDKPSGLEPYVPESAEIIDDDDKTSGEPPAKKIKTEESSAKLTPDDIPLNVEVRHNVYDNTQDAVTLRSEETNKQNGIAGVRQLFCSITGNDVTETRYHNLKSKLNISTRAFEDGQFPAGFKSADYVKLEKAVQGSDSKPWSDQEVLLLLEGLEMFGENWNQIASHVGSRTKEQCISKFIQLPIEDRYLEKQLSKDTYKEYLKQLKLRSGGTTTEGAGKIDLDNVVSWLLKNIDSNVDLSKEADVQKAAKLAYGAIHGNAKAYAEEETKKEDQLLTTVLALSLKKFDIKMGELKALEKKMLEEKQSLVLEKHNLLLDRLSLRKQAHVVRAKLLKAADLGATDEGMQICEEAVIEAKRAPRIIVSKKNELIGKEVDEDEDDIPDADKELAEASDAQPISVLEPKKYSMWSA